jgi:hypothetical protein
MNKKNSCHILFAILEQWFEFQTSCASGNISIVLKVVHQRYDTQKKNTRLKLDQL